MRTLSIDGEAEALLSHLEQITGMQAPAIIRHALETYLEKIEEEEGRKRAQPKVRQE